MNRDQVDGALKDKGDKTQEAAEAAGSSDRHSKGMARLSEASMHKASDDVKVALKNSRHS